MPGILTFLAAATVLHCTWAPDLMPFDGYKLASIMYLYDKKACGYTMHVAKVMASLKISNDTRGLNVLPIKWVPPIVTVSTRLSAKTRMYIELSIAIHIFWMLLAIAFRVITNHNRNAQLLKYATNSFYYMNLFVLVFDLSMAIVYVAHIKQSLTKGMIVRYSGWSVELKLENYEDFAGWLPMVASACWMRGVVILALNIYSVKVLYFIKNKIRKREIMKRFVQERNRPIPEAKHEETLNENVLYYFPGELKPYVK